MASRHRFQLGDAVHVVVVDDGADGRVHLTIDDEAPFEVDATVGGIPGEVSMIVEGRPRRAYVSRLTAGFRVTVDGRAFDVLPVGGGSRPRGAVGGAADLPGHVTAPLAGVVVDVRVAVGDAVVPGQVLVVIEAMKMQNEVQAPHGGTVTVVRCEPGGRVERGDIVVQYDVVEE